MKLQLLFFLMLLGFSSCLLNNDNCWEVYKVEIPLTISPALDTFQIHDTFWLTSEINNTLIDLNSSEELDVSGFNFRLEAGFGKIDSPSISAGLEFDYVNEIGHFNVINTGSVVRTGAIYEEEPTQRRIRIGIVPKTIGGFYFNVYYLNEHFQDINLTNTKCIESMDLIFNMNNNDNEMNNHYLFEGNPSPFVDPENSDEAGVYAFWVTE